MSAYYSKALEKTYEQAVCRGGGGGASLSRFYVIFSCAHSSGASGAATAGRGTGKRGAGSKRKVGRVEGGRWGWGGERRGIGFAMGV